MKAIQEKNGKIDNIVEVESLDVFPNLFPYPNGARIGDSVDPITGAVDLNHLETRDIETEKSELIDEVYAIAKRLNDGVITKYSTGETADWTDMVREAQAGNSAWFTPIVQGTDVTEAGYMQRILDNAQTFRAFKNAVLNAREKHMEAIKALTGNETEPYDIMAHWPKEGNIP